MNNRRAAAAAAVGAVAVAAAALYVRSRRIQNTEHEDYEDDKPQRRFKRVLADNSQTAFVHLNGKEDQHPYAEEVRKLVDAPSFAFSEEETTTSSLEDPFIWIDTREKLELLVDVLSGLTEFAVDTEQHSIRSFLGFTALIQISTSMDDYIVDSIALHDDMHILGPVFADPNICKVFHGADSDILWLQRDFHIYVVNLFDTARACDVLGKSHRSLAFLLKTYCNVSTNKAFQRADWRQRPLPDEMLLYARKDAHFLLDIARFLRKEMLQGRTPEESSPMLELAMRRSNLICLQLYEKETASPAAAAASLFARFQQDKSGNLSQSHEMAVRKRVRALCEWRDATARAEDESLRYVLSDAALLELALAGPSTPDLIFSRISLADNTAEFSNSPQQLPSPSPVVRKHIQGLISTLEASSDFTGQDVVEETSSPTKNIVKSRNSECKPHKAGFKRSQFVKKFSCKGLVYENCRIYAGDGRLLCYCDHKKLEWYLQRGLATTVEDDVPAIRLCFEPKGRPDDENEFYIHSKSNQCVGCGESSHYLRYRIIPSCYRQHFPEYLKSHRSHDIVLLCVDCHEVAHQAAEKYKHVIAAEHGVPLFARKIVDGGGEVDAVIESEDGVSPLQLRNAAIALLCHGEDMPESRREELELLISSYFGGREITFEDLKTAALVGIDPRGEKRLTIKIENIVKRKQKRLQGNSMNPGAVEEPTAAEMTTISLLEAEFINREAVDEPTAAKKSKISLLGHGFHGKKVAEKIWNEHGEQGIRDFIQKWRVVFVEAIRPAYLPSGWDIAHTGHREFGEFSVYRPKWESST